MDGGMAMKELRERADPRTWGSARMDPGTFEHLLPLDLVQALEDLLLVRHLAAEEAEEDLALLACPADGRDSAGYEPGSTEEEIGRDFHRALVPPINTSRSGWML
jgi:hypothetical protein